MQFDRLGDLSWGKKSNQRLSLFHMPEMHREYKTAGTEEIRNASCGQTNLRTFWGPKYSNNIHVHVVVCNPREYELCLLS